MERERTNMRVAAVQLDLAYVSTPQEYMERIRGPVEKAASSGAKLVVLPNYTGLRLLGAVVPEAADGMPLAEIARAGGYPSVREMFTTVGPALHDFYRHIFGSLAEHLHTYLVPGTFVERDETGLYNTAFLFDPDGRVVGSQRQTHRSKEEIGWGLEQGDTLRVFEVGRARLGLVLGEDVRYPEVSRILALQGADILIHPAAYRTWSSQQFLLDLWREVQSNQTFGIEACMVNGYIGQSAIYAPVEMTPRADGILGRASYHDAGQVVVADLDFDRLQQTIDAYPIFSSFNDGLYAREFPQIYANVSRDETNG